MNSVPGVSTAIADISTLAKEPHAPKSLLEIVLRKRESKTPIERQILLTMFLRIEDIATLKSLSSLRDLEDRF
jgi:precorrin-4 methylase